MGFCFTMAFIFSFHFAAAFCFMVVFSFMCTHIPGGFCQQNVCKLNINDITVCQDVQAFTQLIVLYQLLLSLFLLAYFLFTSQFVPGLSGGIK